MAQQPPPVQQQAQQQPPQKRPPTARKQKKDQQPVADNFEKDLEKMKENGKDYIGERREFYNSIIQRVENNSQALVDLRKEHTKMRTYLKQLVETKNKKGATPNLQNEIKKLSHQANFLKKQVDNLRHKKEESIKRQEEIQLILQSYRDTNIHNHPEADKMQELKNKLDNATIKNSETQYLIRVYEQIEYFLNRQKMKFTPELQKQLTDIERKYKDVEDLNVVTRDSKFSRAAAKNDFLRAEKQFNEAKAKRDQIIEQKNNKLKELTMQREVYPQQDSRQGRIASMQNQSVMRNRQTKNKREKKEEELRKKQDQLEQIRDVFGTTDPNIIKGMIDERRHKALTLEENINALKEQSEKYQLEEDQLKRKLEEIQYSFSAGIGSNRLITEGNELLEEKRLALVKVEKEVSAIEKQYLRLVAGINNFPDILQLVITDDCKPPLDDPSGLIDWTAERLKKMKESLENDDFDLLTIVNRRVVYNNMKKLESKQDIQNIDSSKKSQKKHIERFRPANHRDNKVEVVSRVMDRSAVKAMANKALANAKNKKTGK